MTAKMTYSNQHEQTMTLVKGAVGMATSGAGTWISFFTELELALRIASLMVGIGVGLVTIWSIWKHRNDKKKK